MGLRKYKRQIAKGRMTAAGVGNVNKKMHIADEKGVVNWRKALGKDAERPQMRQNAGKKRPGRKIRPIVRAAENSEEGRKEA